MPNNPYHLLENSPNKPPLGSVFLGNTSFSGADIKIVINLYGSPDLTVGDTQQHLREMVSEFESQEKSIGIEIAKAQARGLQIKPSVPDFENWNKNYSKLLQQQNEIRGSLVSAQSRLDEIARKGESTVPSKGTKVLAQCQTLSLSVFRDKKAVRSFGAVYPKGVVRGPREISGSLIFTVFNEDVLYEFLGAHPSDFDAHTFTSAILDQLPPVDIIVSFANEYGAISRMAIYGVEFMTEGKTMSIEDLLSEHVVQYIARDYDPMRAVEGPRKIDNVSHKLQMDIGKTASDLLLEDDYKKYKNALSPFQRLTRRRNPWT